MEKDWITLDVVVDAVIYTNERNGFTVCQVETEELSVCAVGYMPYITEGDTLSLTGSWTVHPEYGEQFKVQYYEKREPSDRVSIIKYLSSGLIKGVGEATAKRIVEAFGEDTLRILRDNPSRLAEVRGISSKKAETIGASFLEQTGVQSVVLFLNRFGITPNFSLKVYQAFGMEAVSKIQENPYCLCEERIGIGFQKVDRIGLGLGKMPEDTGRIVAGLCYLLTYNMQNGHTYLPREKLVQLAGKLLHIAKEDIENALVQLVIQSELVLEKTDTEERVYLKEMLYCEQRVALFLKQLAAQEVTWSQDPEHLVDAAEKEMNIRLETGQRETVLQAISHPVTVITGGPGTGKTTIIRTILGVYERLGLSVELCAPTGRAAKRMSLLCGREAKTVHRLLELSYSEDRQAQFGKNQKDPLRCDVVIVDEASMLDLILAERLLSALDQGTHLILVGDVDQLPSVGPGNVLGDIIASGVLPVMRLTEIFRQAKESQIITNAHAIHHGEYPDLNHGDFFFVHTNSPEEIIPTIVDLCQRRLPQTYHTQSLFDIQVISPSKKGAVGVSLLNQALQEALNPPMEGKAEKLFRDAVFRVGDKVMQIKNNYDIPWTCGEETGNGVFNGDEGTITNIDVQNSCLWVRFEEDRMVRYDFLQMEELELAYGITVHKSQGSEFDIVVIPMYAAPPMLLSRNLLYTAVTRAKRLVVLVGSEKILHTMVDNHRETERFSALQERLWEE